MSPGARPFRICGQGFRRPVQTHKPRSRQNTNRPSRSRFSPWYSIAQSTPGRWGAAESLLATWSWPRSWPRARPTTAERFAAAAWVSRAAAQGWLGYRGQGPQSPQRERGRCTRPCRCRMPRCGKRGLPRRSRRPRVWMQHVRSAADWSVPECRAPNGPAADSRRGRSPRRPRRSCGSRWRSPRHAGLAPVHRHWRAARARRSCGSRPCNSAGPRRPSGWAR